MPKLALLIDLPNGVYAPPARLPGRGGAIMLSWYPSARLIGRAKLDVDVLARLLGRLTSDVESFGPRFGSGPGPNDNLPTPVLLLSRGTCLPLMLRLNPCSVDVESSGAVVLVLTDETDPGPLLRVRIATLLLPSTEPCGDKRGGVGFGAGSRDRAF